MTKCEDLAIGFGIECNVYDVGDNTVYKKYDRNQYLSEAKQKQHARAAFELQRIAAKAGIAPAAISYDGIGYYSEKVRVYGDLNDSEQENFLDGIQKLKSKIDNIFQPGWNDDHPGNFGVKDDGTLCIIDFGLAGFSKTSVGIKIKEKYECDICKVEYKKQYA